jgi:excisionase family DNA binding protein
MQDETSRADEMNFRRNSDILTTIEVARELRCSKAHIHNLINGKVRGAPPLPTIALGRRRLVRRASLDQWLRANECARG